MFPGSAFKTLKTGKSLEKTDFANNNGKGEKESGKYIKKRKKSINYVTHRYYVTHNMPHIIPMSRIENDKMPVGMPFGADIKANKA